MQFNEANPLAASHLGISARLGDEKAVKNLLQQGRRVDIGDNRGWTPLHEAAAANYIVCLRLLLKKGRKYVNQRTMEGETPLLLACCKHESADMVNLLLRNGADVNIGNNEDHTPLHEVCRSGNLRLAEMFVNAGANINAVDFDNSSPFHLAVFSGNMDLLKFLTSRSCDVNIKDDCGRTPLFIACEQGIYRVVKLLIPLYSSLDIRAIDGATPLMLASQRGSTAIVQELLYHGADPNIAANDHSMALHLAVHAGHVDIAKLLMRVTNRDDILRNCSNPEATLTSSLTCLAIESHSFNMLKALLQSDLGADILHLPLKMKYRVRPDRLVYSQTSPMSFLLSFPSVLFDIVKCLNLLIDHGFSVNADSRETMPPLVAMSLEFQHPDCLQLLLSNGADIDYTTNSYGIPDALLAACLSGNFTLFVSLLHAGSSGVPDDVLRLILDENYIYDARRLALKDFILFMLELGISDYTLLKRLHSFCAKVNGLNINFEIEAGENQFSSLQKLCRTVVRRHIKQPFAPSLQKLPVPEVIKQYLTYHIV